MICASLYRPFFIVNLLRYLAEKILLLNTTNFRGDYHVFDYIERFYNPTRRHSTIGYLSPMQYEERAIKA